MTNIVLRALLLVLVAGFLAVLVYDCVIARKREVREAAVPWAHISEDIIEAHAAHEIWCKTKFPHTVQECLDDEAMAMSTAARIQAAEKSGQLSEQDKLLIADFKRNVWASEKVLISRYGFQPCPVDADGFTPIDCPLDVAH